jgi:hypothetical protein
MVRPDFLPVTLMLISRVPVSVDFHQDRLSCYRPGVRCSSSGALQKDLGDCLKQQDQLEKKLTAVRQMIYGFSNALGEEFDEADSLGVGSQLFWERVPDRVPEIMDRSVPRQ